VGLRVALDAREISDPVHGSGTGVGRYVYNLLRQLPLVEPDARFTAFAGPGTRTTLAAGGNGFALRSLPGLPAAAHWVLPLAARREGAQVLHGMANTLPLLTLGVPGVVTLHDLAIYRHPDFFPGGQAFSTRVLVPRTMGSAACVICPSEYTAEEAVSLFRVPRSRLRVIAHGVEDLFCDPPVPSVLEAARRRYRLPDRYVLFVGTLQPRKNLETALHALAGARRRVDIRLVVAGARGWHDQPALDLIPRLGLSDAVQLLGYVPVTDLPALYAQARAFLFPSLYEGFGLPVLEAMASGTPVIASNRTSVPEVAGDAALLLDPMDVAAWADALIRVLQDPVLRTRLVAAGRSRYRQFSWERAAVDHARAYRDVARAR
jgi:glycosyltransferase involved in cell wall biosynthesis